MPQQTTDLSTFKAAMDFLCDRNMLQIEQSAWCFTLMDFQMIHGNDAIISMAGYYLWCIQHDSNPVASIAHDLRDMKEKCMLPRTSGYAEYFNMDTP